VGRRELGDAPERLRAAVAAWGPDVVLVGDGFFLKPLVIEALAAWPVIARYYAYEAICHRDILHFKEGAPCPLNYFETPEVCRRCALEAMAPMLKRGLRTAWVDEYLAARAYAPEYYVRAAQALERVRAFVVYNELMAAQLRRFPGKAIIAPGGVDLETFGESGVWSLESGGPELRTQNSEPSTSSHSQPVILMSGRAEDPVKGAEVLLYAGRRLAEKRDDFLIKITMPLDTPRTLWFEPVGWQLHSEMQRLYAEAAVCVVPSLWDEPFGMVAVEAMAAGCPVCASRVGGLQHIVEHGRTGFLFERGNSAELAQQLAQLLDDPALRHEMGRAARARVEQEYSWPRVVSRYYLPLLERIGDE
ncbi:MAG: glycosyltransferase family 4 protein, partial [Candidatus Hydrogenedentes bacterium]|nr:glycosyltransferase family 4 protein [Candidatus Hydrogenedentota bacterium]